MRGWLKLHRRLADHWMMRDPRHIAAWITILLYACHRPTRVQIGTHTYDLQPGQACRSMQSWARLFPGRWTRQQVRTYLAMLEGEGQVTLRTTNRTTIVSVCQWDTYQHSVGPDNHPDNQRNPSSGQVLMASDNHPDNHPEPDNHPNNHPDNQRNPSSGQVLMASDNHPDNHPDNHKGRNKREGKRKGGRVSSAEVDHLPSGDAASPTPQTTMHGILQAHGMATDHQATSEVAALLRGILDREGAEDTMRARETLLDDLVGWAHDHGQVRIRWARDLEDAAAHRSSGAEAEERRRRAQADAETMAEARAAEIQDLRRRLAAVEGVDQAKGRRAAAMLEAGRSQVAGLIITGLERRQEAGHG